MILSWVELTKLLNKIEKENEEPLQRIHIQQTHLRHEKEYDVSIRPPFRYGDFTILAAKIEGKKGDLRNIRKGRNQS